MFCIREERRDELTKKFEAIFAGLFEHPLREIFTICEGELEWVHLR
ncbi:hypothetical protein ACOI1C_01905 [Bacillus sp. DJP31]